MPQVTIIPATRKYQNGQAQAAVRKKRVAAYARVSTGSEEQETSYEAQINYYTNYIQSRSDWEFVKMYSDKAVTGTSTKKRIGFQEMIKDALEGKIDLIITKSVSRFSRNTVDSLVTIRKLKEKGIEVYFEKENIYTLDSKGEVLLTIMSSLAQDESRSISDNVTWGRRRAYAEGKIYMPYNQFLGYRRGENNLPEIVEEEAIIVRRIYREYLEGKTAYTIARGLKEDGILTPSKKSTDWRGTTIESILRNEKYKGSAILQKTFVVDFLTKKQKKNEGEVPQYYVEKSHPWIVTPEEFEIVQNEIERRKSLGPKYSGNTIFAARVICADCGCFYGPKVWHSTDKYKKVIYRCNNKYNDKKCTTPTITEEMIKAGFVRAVNRMLLNREKILEDCRTIQGYLTNTDEIDAQIKEKKAEESVVAELLRKMVDQSAHSAVIEDDYWEKYKGLEERYERLGAEITKLTEERTEKRRKADVIGAFMFELKEREDAIEEFDARMWTMMIDSVLVRGDKTLVYQFRNGVSMEEKVR